MDNKLTQLGRKFAFRHNLLTASIVLSISLLVLIVWGDKPAISALIGGLIGLIPNLLFAYKAFKYAGARSARKVVDSFFSGVKQKMVLTAILFGLTFKFMVIIPLPFFGMFCLVMAMPFITSVVIKQ